MNKLEYKIHNRDMAIELTQNGFGILKIIQNKKETNRDIYIFEDTQSFRDTFTTISNNYNKRIR